MSPPGKAAAMREAAFQRAYPLALRAAQVRVAAAAGFGTISRGEGEDFAQEALLKLWTALQRYDPSRAGLATFVERITENRLASWMRRRRGPAVEPLDDHQPATSDGIPAVQFRVDFQRILASLTEVDRAVAQLLLDHGPTEVSRMLGIARSTVYARRARLRRAFREAGYGAAESQRGAR